jgi:hypothetical protein
MAASKSRRSLIRLHLAKVVRDLLERVTGRSVVLVLLEDRLEGGDARD